MSDLNTLRQLFETPLLQQDLTLTGWHISGTMIRFHFILGTVSFFIDEEFSIDLPDNESSLHFHKLIEYFYLTKAFKYSQHFLVKNLIVQNSVLSSQEQEFWQEYYTTYSMELFYTQQIDLDHLVKLQFQPVKNPPSSQAKPNLSGEKILLGVGGGKDAIYAFELLTRSGIEVDLLYTYWKDSDKQLRKNLCAFMQEKVPCSVYSIWRGEHETPEVTDTIVKQWSKGIKPSAPAVSVNALRMAIIAWIKNYRYITTASEKSADTGSVDYHGYLVNHQYSKSIEFEKKLIDLLHQHVHPDLHYFSILKPMYELKIAEGVSQLNEYFGSFTSCNRDNHWCLNCSKCAFVFTLFAAFLSPEEITAIFPENLFDKPSLRRSFQELTGLDGVRPFECVGDQEETNVAMWHAMTLGHTGYVIDLFRDHIAATLSIKSLDEKYFHLYLEDGEHCIPKELLAKINWKSII